MLIPGRGDTLADAVGKVARAYDASLPLRFVRHVGDDDAYHRGEAPGGWLIVVPGIWTGMPPELLAAMRRRRAATVTGRCPQCDACAAPATGAWLHEHGCAVADASLRPMFAAWARKAGQYARGRRICEDPA